MTDRIRARAAGALYLLTHVTSVAAVVLYGRGGIDPNAALHGRGAVLTGAFLELVLAAGVVGTAVALYPLLRGRSPGGAAGYLAFRLLEAGVIALGVVAITAAVATPGTSDAPGLSPDVAYGLVSMHAWTFLIGPGLVCPINTVVLAVTLRRHHLVPGWITALGLAGAPLVALGNGLALFGRSNVLAAAALVLFAWEISLAIYLLTRWAPSASGASRTADAAPLVA